jgi:hypothetical protein
MACVRVTQCETLSPESSKMQKVQNMTNEELNILDTM